MISIPKHLLPILDLIDLPHIADLESELAIIILSKRTFHRILFVLSRLTTHRTGSVDFPTTKIGFSKPKVSLIDNLIPANNILKLLSEGLGFIPIRPEFDLGDL
ncbi:MAG: hypothetical protein MHMPM18_004655 [Marteilia pararefringens]